MAPHNCSVCANERTLFQAAADGSGYEPCYACSARRCSNCRKPAGAGELRNGRCDACVDRAAADEEREAMESGRWCGTSDEVPDVRWDGRANESADYAAPEVE